MTMIEKNVVIFVRGEQTYDGADPDATELISEGTMSIDDGGAVTVTYQETELTGMEGTTTRFTTPAPTFSCFSTRFTSLDAIPAREKLPPSM